MFKVGEDRLYCQFVPVEILQILPTASPITRGNKREMKCLDFPGTPVRFAFENKFLC